MAEKEQTDVEMKDVSDEPKSDAEGGKEKVQEKTKDVNLLTIEGKGCGVSTCTICSILTSQYYSHC